MNRFRGFTLVEIIVAIAILIIIMIAVSSFQYNVINYNRSGAVALTNAQEIQALLKIMTKEMRSMEQGSDGAYPLIATATSSITFFADVDNNSNKERVRYYIATTTLYRGVIKPVGSPATYPSNMETKKILITGIRNSPTSPIFEYFDAMYSGTSSPMSYPLNLTSIRLVKTTLTIDTDPAKSPVLRTFTTQVGLRNLKDNL
ncbi:MAG: hypothetical protein A3C79_03260 [Candidatus Taylorbacteria bacterium RIFCSPHIGHO2_02_FULL_45_28]|uniref:Type II secretion system protein J n=1 Tax=Candidatus Taylorbacteria bacterium RIFCSPHIGHO2_12_FULL_45_16 TaxID=1802315 RepID=A0A1G2N186_9BACT|nr:MAG: hypothetical protein A2830_00980 [Candidatus Taylorbacteria bacterium RIFCSPHIGHO2_01_FULL_44_110]OHA24975.1 MAG: hypothetical protein A3C79_03260 [Candidatus Taylorbacteria bacterium RIFCSPHIGHO2_02_FULL_45_28]OHA29793.1 MAG: hypothetical protein A3F51_03675 [Candidatus Taylorbacteria bacterium RIFCSPHIGHO2_12_FULL_45_16]OHA32737.1 MAG: hypothetical protein A3A23_00545 [Candidatus Taylorbacteria bacterium RIFCSPLOWO2_01_FULL_45_59]OHA39031.1 MAG: hypothetical protein A3I98_00120 [Candi